MENKGKMILVQVIEIVAALALGVLGASYLNNYFGDDDVKETTKCDVRDEATDVVTIDDYPKESDNGLVTYNLMNEFNEKQKSLVFDSITVPIEGINFDFYCSSHDMDGEEIEECTRIEVLVNGYLITSINVEYEAPKVIITDDYIITQEGLGNGYWGDIGIFEHYGRKAKTIGQTQMSYYKNDKEIADTNMRVVDNKLYFIVSDVPENYSCESSHKNIYKYIDLKNNLDEHTIQSFNAKTCSYE